MADRTSMTPKASHCPDPWSAARDERNSDPSSHYRPYSGVSPRSRLLLFRSLKGFSHLAVHPRTLMANVVSIHILARLLLKGECEGYSTTLRLLTPPKTALCGTLTNHILQDILARNVNPSRLQTAEESFPGPPLDHWSPTASHLRVEPINPLIPTVTDQHPLMLPNTQ